MDPDALAVRATRVARDRDLRRDVIPPVPRPWREAPEGRCASMAQYCALAASQNYSHPPALPAQSGVADGVNPAVNAEQMPGRDTSAHSALGDPHVIELGREITPC
jgi:hypothetical protein